MIWTAWNNGANHASGAGYGFKIEASDRDQYFQSSWQTITLTLPSSSGDTDVIVNVAKASFWNKTCREVISKKIGQWLLDNHYAPWTKGSPPKFDVQHVATNQFKLIKKL